MGYSVVNADEIEGAGPEGSFIRLDAETTRCPVAGGGVTFVCVGMRRGSHEPRCPF